MWCRAWREHSPVQQSCTRMQDCWGTSATFLQRMHAARRSSASHTRRAMAPSHLRLLPGGLILCPGHLGPQGRQISVPLLHCRMLVPRPRLAQPLHALPDVSTPLPCLFRHPLAPAARKLAGEQAPSKQALDQATCQALPTLLLLLALLGDDVNSWCKRLRRVACVHEKYQGHEKVEYTFLRRPPDYKPIISVRHPAGIPTGNLSQRASSHTSAPHCL